MYQFRSKTLFGNPVRYNLQKHPVNGLIIIHKYVYSKEPLRFFEVMEEFPKRFGRTMYYQIQVFNDESISTIAQIYFTELSNHDKLR
jgi:hypothetical protein